MQPIKRLDISGGITYTYSKAGFGNVSFPNVMPQLMALNPLSPQNYAWGSFKADWPSHYPTFEEMNDFSDLRMDTIDMSAVANYRVTDKLLMNFSVDYRKFNDKEYYIYDGDGSITYVGVGLQYLL